jgi:hypothetical protein
MQQLLLLLLLQHLLLRSRRSWQCLRLRLRLHLSQFLLLQQRLPRPWRLCSRLSRLGWQLPLLRSRLSMGFHLLLQLRPWLHLLLLALLRPHSGLPLPQLSLRLVHRSRPAVLLVLVACPTCPVLHPTRLLPLLTRSWHLLQHWQHLPL